MRVVVQTPTKLSDKQKEILRDFSKELGEEAHEPSKSFFDRMKSAFKGE